MGLYVGPYCSTNGKKIMLGEFICSVLQLFCLSL
jgi:hypothetical protein